MTWYEFYEAMGYPIPSQKELFSYLQATKDIPSIQKGLSWSTPNIYLQEYIDHIKKYQYIRKYIPCIDEVYLCNSITFNSIWPESDIDVFIVTKTWYLWRARFWSVIILFILWQKRFGTKHRKKFCLSMYVDQSAKNMYPLRAWDDDVYFCYWLAHLVPLYFVSDNQIDTIYKKNNRLTSFMPNFPMTHSIDVGSTPTIWISKIKKRLERWCMSKVWKILQWCIKYFWLPILMYKKNQLGKIGNNVIVSDTVMRFYYDKRQQYNILIKKQRRANSKKYIKGNK